MHEVIEGDIKVILTHKCILMHKEIEKGIKVILTHEYTFWRAYFQNNSKLSPAAAFIGLGQLTGVSLGYGVGGKLLDVYIDFPYEDPEK